MIGVRVTLVFVSSVVLLAACGGGAPESKMPGAMKGGEPPEPDPSSIEEAQQRIATAKAELASGAAADTSTGRTFAEPPPAGDAARPSPAPPPSTSPVERPSTSESTVSQQKATRNVEERCSSPCRALSSMRRAVTALCRMTGNEDARCVDARRTLASSEAQIAPCSC